jgi:DNA-binding LacI/PurR family transcriptional regulator
MSVVQVVRRHYDYLDAVTADNVSGARKATEHLLDLGYRRIACVAATFSASSIKDRVAGYKKALASRGVPFDPSLIHAFDTDPDTSAAAAKAILSGPHPPDAVLSLNHVQVFGFLKVARDLKIAIPQQLGIIVYDEMPWSSLTDPPLTSVSQPIAELASQTAHLLIERMQSTADRPAKPARIVLPVTLIDRRSCGTASAHAKIKASQRALEQNNRSHAQSTGNTRGAIAVMSPPITTGNWESDAS